MKHVKVGGMSEASYGLRTLERIRDEKLGNYTVLFAGPWSLEKLRQVVTFCKENNMCFVMDEMWSRRNGVLRSGYTGINKEEFRKIIAEAGETFDGTLFMCEYGGLTLYWPQSTVAGSPNLIPPTECAAVAKDSLVTKLRQLIKSATDSIVSPPLICIEAAGIAKYLYEAGIDRVDLEVTYSPFTELCYSAIKGATIAYNKDRFGVDMAMVWYGGNEHDVLWRHRWRTSLYHAFIRGADPIYAEHGIMDYKALGKNFSTDSEQVKMFRKELSDFARFCASHPRPSGFPMSRIAVISGNLDSFAPGAFGQPYIWGQRGSDGIKTGTAEDSWELFNSFYQKLPWEFRYVLGEQDLSGNPPLGQVDIIPAESSLSLMRNYDCLIFLGWNTMTPEIYNNIEKYVRQGGHILATLAHFDTRTKRNAPISLIHDGDFQNLFGLSVDIVKDKTHEGGIKFKQQPSRGNYNFPLWTEQCDPKYYDGGFPLGDVTLTTAEVIAVGSDVFSDTWENMFQNPIFVTNKLGKGMAFLVNSTEFPGCRGLKRFYKDLLHFFAVAWQKDIIVETCDHVRFAVYAEGDMHIIYLLNTEPNCIHQAIISNGSNNKIPFNVPPGEPIAVYTNELCLVCPKDLRTRIVKMEMKKETLLLSLPSKQEFCKEVLVFIDGGEWKGKVTFC